MAITPLPLEDTHDDPASRLPQELRSGDTQDTASLPAGSDADAGEATRTQDDAAHAADGSVPQLVGDADSSQANGEAGAKLQVAGHIDVEVSAETVPPVAPQDSVAPPPADRVEGADEDLPPDARLEPPIEAPPATGPVGRALLETLSHLPLPPPLQVQAGPTAAAPRNLPGPADDGPRGEPGGFAAPRAGDGTGPVAPGRAQAGPTAVAPLANVIDAALKLTADANAAAEALENLKRLLDRDPPAPPIARKPVVANVQIRQQPARPLAPARPGAGAGGRAVGRPVQPLRPTPPAPRERRRLDVHGFFAGVAMALAFGALLYLLLAAG